MAGRRGPKGKVTDHYVTGSATARLHYLHSQPQEPFPHACPGPQLQALPSQSLKS